MRQLPKGGFSAGEAIQPAKSAGDCQSSWAITASKREASGAVFVSVGGFSLTVGPAQAAVLGLDTDTLQLNACIDEETLSLLKLADEASRAEKAAILLLSRAEQSAYLLSMKLAERGYSRSAVKLALEKLQKEELLDDRRFARAFVASRLNRSGSKPEGPASLKALLLGKGLQGEVVTDVLKECFGPEEAADNRRFALEGAARKAQRRLPGQPDQVFALLRKLGYKPGEIKDSLESLGGEKSN